MNKFIVIIFALFFAFAGCLYYVNRNVEMLQEKVEQLQSGVTVTQDTDNETAAPRKQSDTSRKQSDAGVSTTKTESTGSKEQKAINAVKYCMNKYLSGFKYDRIHSVPKSDGTIDVVVDYKSKYAHDDYHTYYNVSVFKNGEFCINHISGNVVEFFPYGDKFTIQ